MPKTSWSNFKELRAIAEEGMLEERFAVENNGRMRDDVCRKFASTFSPELVHNLLSLVESFADTIVDYRGTHIGCDVIKGVDNRCQICRKLEEGTFSDGAFIVMRRVEKDEVKDAE